MVINFGTGVVATTIVNILIWAKAGMKVAMGQLITLCIMLMILNIVYEIFLLSVEGDLNQVLNKIFTELLYVVFFIFLLFNWVGGLNILENVIEPLFFQNIPGVMFKFKVGSYYLWEKSNTVLLNLDALWNSLESIPEGILKEKNGLEILVEWVIFSKIGGYIAMLALQIMTYIMVMLIFADIVRMVLGIHLMYIFSGVLFPLMTLKFFREQYGLNLPKILITCAIQYYMLFLLVGLLTGFVYWVREGFGPFIHILALVIIMGTFKGVMRSVNEAAGKL